MTITKSRTLANPGRRRRARRRNGPLKMSKLQKLFFGTKKQREAARRSNSGRKRRKVSTKRKRSPISSLLPNPRRRHARVTNRRRRRRNVGTILTVYPAMAGLNPGRKRKRSRVSRVSNRRRRVSNRRRRVVTVTKIRKRVTNKGMARRKRRTRVSNRRRRRNPFYSRRVKRGVYQYTARRRNPGRRRRRHVMHHRRRHNNPGVSSGLLGKALGIIGGATATKILMGFVPSALSQGFVGYFTTALVAYAGGRTIGKVAKSRELGNNLVIGGFVYLAIKVLNDYFPSIGGNLGLSGGRGMGLIAPSNFYVPQVNVPGSMGSFVPPPAVAAAMALPMAPPAAAGMRGLGTTRRIGRVR